MTKAPGAYISHSTLARVRFRVPEKRGDTAYFNEVKAQLESEKGIAGVEVNPKTASVLVFHGTTEEKVAQAAAKTGLFAVSAEAVHHDPGQHFVGLGPDLKRLVPPFLILLALIQVMRGNLFAPASALFLTALNMMLSGQHGGFAGTGDFQDDSDSE